MSTTSKHRIDIHNYKARMKQINDQIERELSSENTTLIKRYDREMVSQSMATATRQKHLRTLLTLSRLLNKNWEEVTKDDIDELVFEVSVCVLTSTNCNKFSVKLILKKSVIHFKNYFVKCLSRWILFPRLHLMQ